MKPAGGGNISSGLVDKIKQYYNKGTKIRDVSLNNSDNWVILSGDSGWWGACSEDAKSILRKGRKNIKSSNESSTARNISQSNSTRPSGVNVFKEMSQANVWAEFKGYSKQDIINRLIKLIEVGPIMSKKDSKNFNHGGPAWTTEHRLKVKARYQNNQIIITSSYTDNKQTKRGWVPSTKSFRNLIDFNKLKGVSMENIWFERRDFVNGAEKSLFKTSINDGFKTDEYGRRITIYAPTGASNPELAKRYIWAISNL